ncbi:uncharacterized protein LOC144455706 [Phascolarctos cinereus]
MGEGLGPDTDPPPPPRPGAAGGAGRLQAWESPGRRAVPRAGQWRARRGWARGSLRSVPAPGLGSQGGAARAEAAAAAAADQGRARPDRGGQAAGSARQALPGPREPRTPSAAAAPLPPLSFQRRGLHTPAPAALEEERRVGCGGSQVPTMEGASGGELRSPSTVSCRPSPARLPASAAQISAARCRLSSEIQDGRHPASSAASGSPRRPQTGTEVTTPSSPRLSGRDSANSRGGRRQALAVVAKGDWIPVREGRKEKGKGGGQRGRGGEEKKVTRGKGGAAGGRRVVGFKSLKRPWRPKRDPWSPNPNFYRRGN